MSLRDYSKPLIFVLFSLLFLIVACTPGVKQFEEAFQPGQASAVSDLSYEKTGSDSAGQAEIIDRQSQTVGRATETKDASAVGETIKIRVEMSNDGPNTTDDNDYASVSLTAPNFDDNPINSVDYENDVDYFGNNQNGNNNDDLDDDSIDDDNMNVNGDDDNSNDNDDDLNNNDDSGLDDIDDDDSSNINDDDDLNDDDHDGDNHDDDNDNSGDDSNDHGDDHDDNSGDDSDDHGDDSKDHGDDHGDHGDDHGDDDDGGDD